MTADQQTLLMFKGLLASLPGESQVKVIEAEKRLREVLAEYPTGEAMIAFGLIGAEAQMDGIDMVAK